MSGLEQRQEYAGLDFSPYDAHSATHVRYHRIYPICALKGLPSYGYHHESNTVDVISVKSLKRWPGYSEDLTLETLATLNDVKAKDFESFLNLITKRVTLCGPIIFPIPTEHAVLIFTGPDDVGVSDYGFIVPRRPQSRQDLGDAFRLTRIGSSF